MKLYEKWSAYYETNRYMEHLTDERVGERFKYLFENVLTLTDDGRIGCVQFGDRGAFLWELFQHVLVEQRLRKSGPMIGHIKDADIPTPRTEIGDQLLAASTEVSRYQPHLLKFGQSKYLSDAANEGVLRVSLASTYSDSSMNAAQKDNEMELSQYLDPKEAKITTQAGEVIEAVSTIDMTYMAETDYYVWCCSDQLDYRLFDDFGADCCLLIKDSFRFADDFEAAIKDQVSILDIGCGPVEYLDPVTHRSIVHGNVSKKQPFVQAGKHIRYFYQNEYRLVVIPSETGNSLPDHLTIRIPDLPSYSKLVLL